MKIIGKTETGYLLDATEYEVARIAGAYSMSGSEWARVVKIESIVHDSRTNEPRVGAVIPVNEWWDRLMDVKLRETELAALSDKLRGLADLIGAAWPAVTMSLPGAPKK